MDTETDPNPTELLPVETAAKREVSRFYDGPDGTILQRTKGVDEVLPAVTDQRVRDLLVREGVIFCRIRGASMDDITTGKAIPDRTAPAVKIAKEKAPTKPIQAIANVRAAHLTKAAKARKEKPDADAIKAEALTWARGLSAIDYNHAVTSVEVRAELDKLRGKTKSIASLFDAGDGTVVL